MAKILATDVSLAKARTADVATVSLCANCFGSSHNVPESFTSFTVAGTPAGQCSSPLTGRGRVVRPVLPHIGPLRFRLQPVQIDQSPVHCQLQLSASQPPAGFRALRSTCELRISLFRQRLPIACRSNNGPSLMTADD